MHAFLLPLFHSGLLDQASTPRSGGAGVTPEQLLPTQPDVLVLKDAYAGLRKMFAHLAAAARRPTS
jgi:hypothetical protein